MVELHSHPPKGPVARNIVWRSLQPGQRFVVATGAGLMFEGPRHFSLGEEIPPDILPWNQLKVLYDIGRIDVILEDREHAEDLVAKPASSSSEDRPKVDLPENLDELGRKELYALCTSYRISTDGSNSALRERLRALVG